jgi:hypothetical protein
VAATLCCIVFFCTVAVPDSSAEFSPENLPADTYAYLALGSVDEALRAFDSSPWGRLTQSSEFGPFWRDSLEKFHRKIVTPLERELRAELGEYLRLLDGPLLLALIASERTDILLNDSCLLIAQTRQNPERLRALLEKQKENWKRDGVEVPVQKVEEVEFCCFTLSREVLERFIVQLGAPEGSFFAGVEGFPAGGVNLWVGLEKRSLILALGDLSVAGKALRAEAGRAPRLKSLQSHVVQERAVFRNTLVQFWVQPPPIVKALHGLFQRSMEALEAETAAAGRKLNPFFPNPALLLDSLHLESIRSIGAGWTLEEGRMRCRFHLESPVAIRKGLSELLNAAEMGDCRTPEFVPAGALSAWRLRMKLPEALAALDRVSNEAYPLKRLLFLGFEEGYSRAAPELDLAEGLLKPLGRELLFYEVAPVAAKAGQPDWVCLVGSAEPALFLSSLQMLGLHTRKAIGLDFPYVLKQAGGAGAIGVYQAEPLRSEGGLAPLYLAALGERGEGSGYIAISSAEAPLRELQKSMAAANPGSGAARKVEAPLFFFREENSLEKTRFLWERFRGSGTTAAGESVPLSQALPFPLNRLDYGALPAFESCVRYFCTATLVSLTVTPQGLDGTVLKVFP